MSAKLQLDLKALEIVTQIANTRVTLEEPRAGLAEGSPAAVFLHRRQLMLEIEVLKERLLNHLLRAAGMEHAIDPNTLPMPVCPQQHPRRFVPPEKPQVKALEIPPIHK